ncbi:MAG TPA: inositol monophosphatase family protein [Gemmatimonadales bacterium]|nr:inositol monophosphatase family protein [Gemmatimonadales bacterium]
MSNPAAGLARIAERAAQAAAAYLRTTVPPARAEWTSKTPHDFVTVVDRTSEALVREHLLAAEPDSRVLGEELSPEDTDRGGLVWVVDPLDGTTNYLHRYPWWAVSIAAVVDGEFLAGCVLQVPTSERCTAWRGGGAWIGGERLAVSTISDPGPALLGTGFPFKTPEQVPRYLQQLARVFPATSGVRRAGSAALDLAAVARGQLDAFWELTLAPWDMAAGVVLIREAGGVITDLAGEPIRLAHSGVVAGNPAMHEWLLRQTAV